MRPWLAGGSVSALTPAILAGALLGAGGYTVSTSEATAYFRDDPKACINCHIMREQFDGWQKASHHGHATCNDCHMPPGFVNKYWTKAERHLALDFVAAENSMGFHAPGEAARLLAEAIDYARLGQVAAPK